MIWYEISLNAGVIEKVEVEKHNDKSVWVKRGYKFMKRQPRADQHTEFHFTFESARKAGREHLEKKIQAAMEEVHLFSKRLGHLESTELEYLPDPPSYDEKPFVTAEMILNSE
jgi:hypothetical protein